MKNLMRNLTLSAAALAALVVAPKSNAEGPRRVETRETFRGNPGHGGNFRGGDQRGREVRGNEFRGGDFRGREFRGYGGYNLGFARPQAYSYGRPYIAPFRVFAGSRFYSYCPGPGYIFIDDFGWVFPPFPGAAWIPAHDDRFGVRIGGFWR